MFLLQIGRKKMGGPRASELWGGGSERGDSGSGLGPVGVGSGWALDLGPWLFTLYTVIFYEIFFFFFFF
jgi:hypothetical protein